jgi:hypothetical protein
MTLPDDTWFVRSNGGQGSYPVTRQGWLVVAGFLAGMALSALVAFGLFAPGLAAFAVFGIGAALSASAFIGLARRHTDFTLTHTEYVKRKRTDA